MKRGGVDRRPRAAPGSDDVEVVRVAIHQLDGQRAEGQALGNIPVIALADLGLERLTVLIRDHEEATGHAVAGRPVLGPLRAGVGLERQRTGHLFGFGRRRYVAVCRRIRRLRRLRAFDGVAHRGGGVAIAEQVVAVCRCSTGVGADGQIGFGVPGGVLDREGHRAGRRAGCRRVHADGCRSILGRGQHVAPFGGRRAVGRVGTLPGQRLVQESRLVRVVGSEELIRHRQGIEATVADELGVDVVLTTRVEGGSGIRERPDGIHQHVVVADFGLGPRGVPGRRTVVLVRGGANCQCVTELVTLLRTRCRYHHRSRAHTVEGVGPGRALYADGRGLATLEGVVGVVVVGLHPRQRPAVDALLLERCAVAEVDDTGLHLIEAERDRRLLDTEDFPAQAQVVLAVIAGPAGDVLIDVHVHLLDRVIGLLDVDVDVIAVGERTVIVRGDRFARHVLAGHVGGSGCGGRHAQHTTRCQGECCECRYTPLDVLHQATMTRCFSSGRKLLAHTVPSRGRESVDLQMCRPNF